MSAIFKGTAGPVMMANEPSFDTDTGAKYFVRTWQGSETAILGLTVDLEAQGISYSTQQQGPVYTLTARIPWIVPEELPADRYEITTESQEKSIFEHPAAIAAAEEYDSLLTTPGAQTWREVVEEAVATITDFQVNNGATGTIAAVIRHLRNSVTGWQIDFIVLRRFRQVSLEYAASAGKIGLDDGQFIYSTGQLNLPATVAFSLPATPADPSSDYSWGWRKRGQRVDILGNFAEQTVELVFAPWSTFLYSNATASLNW